MLFNNQHKPVTLAPEEELTCRKARQLQEYLEKGDKEPTKEMRKILSMRTTILRDLREMLIPATRKDSFFRLDQRARITG